MNDSNDSDAIAELLTLTVEVNERGTRRYRNSLGQRHRQYGPAIELVNGSKAWYQNDQLHRTTGPAIEWADGDKEWYLDGQQLTEAEFNERFK